MLNKDTITILSEAYKKIGTFGHSIVKNREVGLEDSPGQNKLKEKLIKSAVLYERILKHIVLNDDGNKVLAVYGVEVGQLNQLLYCLKDTAEINYYPATPTPLRVFEVTIGQKGDDGDEGPAGQNAYVYIAYADDANGAGFDLNDEQKDYIAIVRSTVELVPPLAIHFAGKWKNIKGAKGDMGGGQKFHLTNIGGNFVVDRFPLSYANAARWEFIINGDAQKAGSIIGTWTETGDHLDIQPQSTISINGTLPIVFSIYKNGDYIELHAVIDDANLYQVIGTRWLIPHDGNFAILQSSSLAEGHIFIGGEDNLAAAKEVSKHATLNKDGELTIEDEVITNEHIAEDADIATEKLASKTPDKIAGFDEDGKLIATDFDIDLLLQQVAAQAGVIEVNDTTYTILATGVNKFHNANNIAARIFTLPDIEDVPVGQIIWIKDAARTSSTASIIVKTFGTQLIEATFNRATISSAKSDSCVVGFYTNGIKWFIIELIDDSVVLSYVSPPLDSDYTENINYDDNIAFNESIELLDTLAILSKNLNLNININNMALYKSVGAANTAVVVNAGANGARIYILNQSVDTGVTSRCVLIVDGATIYDESDADTGSPNIITEANFPGFPKEEGTDYVFIPVGAGKTISIKNGYVFYMDLEADD